MGPQDSKADVYSLKVQLWSGHRRSSAADYYAHPIPRSVQDAFAVRRHRSILDRRSTSCDNQAFPLRRSSVPGGREFATSFNVGFTPRCIASA
jgi:hypothetical protein